jgi:hypothetical protein
MRELLSGRPPDGALAAEGPPILPPRAIAPLPDVVGKNARRRQKRFEVPGSPPCSALLTEVSFQTEI